MRPGRTVGLRGLATDVYFYPVLTLFELRAAATAASTTKGPWRKPHRARRVLGAPVPPCLRHISSTGNSNDEKIERYAEA